MRFFKKKKISAQVLQVAPDLHASTPQTATVTSPIQQQRRVGRMTKDENERMELAKTIREETRNDLLMQYNSVSGRIVVSQTVQNTIDGDEVAKILKNQVRRDNLRKFNFI